MKGFALTGMLLLILPLPGMSGRLLAFYEQVEVVHTLFHYSETDSLPPSLEKSHYSGTYKPAATGRLFTRIRLENHSAQPQQVVLPVGNVPEATLHQPDGKVLQTGMFIPVHERSDPYHSPLFTFTVDTGVLDYLLTFDTRGRLALPRHFSPQLVSNSEQRVVEQNRMFSQGFIIGIILVMALYNFMLFMSVRDISYLYYVLSILGIGLYFMFYYGFTREYLWPSAPVWDSYSFAFIVPLTGLARVMFTRTYLNTPQLLPLGDRFFRILLYLYVIPMAMGAAALFLGLPWYEYTIDVIGILGPLVLVAMLVAGIMTLRKGYTPAMFFIVANVLFVLGANVFIFKEVGIYEDNFLSRYTVQVGVIAQVVLFSLGLAYRLKKARNEAADQKLAAKRMELEKEVEKKMLIEKQKAELEYVVQERTQELRESISKLQASEKGLRQLNKIKDKLFSVVSHDLRGPVATLDSFVSIITNHAADVTPEELKMLSGKTHQSVKNLSFLLDNLLNWSRSQMGTLVYSPDAVPLRDIVQQNMELHANRADSKKITLVADVHPQVTVMADRSMMDFIIRNLLSNAIKFTKPYGTVKISASVTDDQVEIRVEDTGVGMDKKVLDRIMEPESTYSTRGTDKEPGTGLGLLLTKEFLEKHGTELKAISEPGQGTIFTFTMQSDPAAVVTREVY
jgi:signal transduction histidine kinase